MRNEKGTMKFLFYILLAIAIGASLVAMHISLTKQVRMDRLKTMQYLDEANQQLHYYKGKEADTNRQPKWVPPKYKIITKRGEK